MPGQCTNQKGSKHVLTLKYIIQVEKLLFIIQIITASILLIAWAFGCSPSVEQMGVKTPAWLQGRCVPCWKLFGQ